jgi:formamidopyrimidine-DNA glycosylase
MPELPEVETVRRGLEPHMVGQVIDYIALRRPNLRYPFPVQFEQTLLGAEIKHIGRRAKYLLCHITTVQKDDLVWITHLGMTGRFTIYNDGVITPGYNDGANTPGRFHNQIEPREAHEHVVLSLRNETQITYCDPRRFGFMHLIPEADISQYPAFAKMGPEPTQPIDVAGLLQRLSHRSCPIKSALLDQSVLAGLGNIYVCEALFRAGISPKTRANKISKQRLARLSAAIEAVIAEAILAGGSTLRDFRASDGELGYFQHQFDVYDRANEACSRTTCQGIIKRIVQSGRSSFYCGTCQR